MDWNSQLLSTAEMRKAGRICDDRIAYERTQSIIDTIAVRIINNMMIQARAVPGLNARPPTSANHSGYAASMAAYSTASDGAHVRQEPRVVHHECHHLAWISTDAEKLQPIVHDNILEDQVCR